MTRGFGMAKDIFDPWDNPSAQGVRLTKATALRSPEPVRIVPSAKDDRRPIQERLDELARAEERSVALAQPHRRGSDDKRLSTALGQLLRGRAKFDELYGAGDTYAAIVRAEKRARGFFAIGSASEDGEQFCREPCAVEVCTLRRRAGEKCFVEQKAAAIKAKDDADAILVSVTQHGPRILERLVYDDLKPSPYREEVIIHLLTKLAGKWS